MNEISLILFTYEQDKHHGILLYEWLLLRARKEGMALCAVFRGVAGYGWDKKIHEEHFFELASNVPMKIELICTEEQFQKFIEIIKKENIKIVYYKNKIDVHF